MTHAEIFALLGQRVVLLKIAPGSKAPIDQGWTKLTLADMTEAYLATLNGNIGVKLGPDSRIGSIDCDNDESAQQFLDLNPALAGSPISNGARGCNVWINPIGCPDRSHKIKTKDGQPWGEWRWTGNQTVISGTHPSGTEYRIKGGPVLEVDFESIVWPDDLVLPWAPKPKARAMTEQELVDKCGPFFWVDRFGNASKINQSYIAEKFCLENYLLFEQDEGWFFVFDAETGAWVQVAADVIKTRIKEAYERLVVRFGRLELHKLVNDGVFNSITSLTKAISGRTKVFQRIRRILHCKNGMLHLEGDFRLEPFSPDYYSRNPLPIPYNPDAKCEKWLAFLNRVLKPDDVSLLQRWFGSALLTGNVAQRLLILVGIAQSGKSTIAEVVEFILGRVNVTALRTEMLHERFEIGRLFGYTLLTAKDVAGDFLEQKGARVLKALVGHDYTPGERKHGMKHIEVYGDYDGMITCNNRLAVVLDADVEAWRRRLMILEFLRAIPASERIGNFANMICEEEGEGILVWAVAGALAHMEELASPGANFKTTSEQDARVDRLLEESESVAHFVRNRIRRVDGGDGLATAEIISGYMDYCTEREWRARGVKETEQRLVDLMMTIHGVNAGAHIERNGKRVRGYPNVEFYDTGRTS